MSDGNQYLGNPNLKSTNVPPRVYKGEYTRVS